MKTARLSFFLKKKFQKFQKKYFRCITSNKFKKLRKVIFLKIFLRKLKKRTTILCEHLQNFPLNTLLQECRVIIYTSSTLDIFEMSRICVSLHNCRENTYTKPLKHRSKWRTYKNRVKKYLRCCRDFLKTLLDKIKIR